MPTRWVVGQQKVPLSRAQKQRREGEGTAQCLCQLGKCVEALLSSKSECRGIRCDPALPHALIHKEPPILLMSLLWQIINVEAAYMCCQYAMEFGIEYDLLWHWKSACPSQKTSTCFRKDKCAPINLLIKNTCSINKKAFIDFINSKTMSTPCQANPCTAY